jgi:hypothetical protein
LSDTRAALSAEEVHVRLLPVVLLPQLLVASATADGAELQARTLAAFDRYVTATESRIAAEVKAPSRTVWLDTLPAERRATALDSVRRGELFIERMRTAEGGRTIEAPGGLIHHWLGVAFIPGATTQEAVTLLQDYNRHGDIYAPAVARSKLLARSGESFQVYLRFYMKKIITVVLNSEHQAEFTRPSPGFAYSRIVSTRIAEVEQPDTPGEREKPIGNDGGYLWRLNTYWRFVERDGGVYLQCESISLTRGIPTGFGWLIGPFVTSIPRESLAFTLETTRRVLAAKQNA